MLCAQLKKLGIDVTATSMLEQMDAEGASWLEEAGSSFTFEELERYMQEHWFLSKDRRKFRVPVAMSGCFNDQCTLRAEQRVQYKEAKYQRHLFNEIRKSHKQPRFVIGCVNFRRVSVDGNKESTCRILHDEAGNELHALGLLSTDYVHVKGWNSWSGRKVVEINPKYIHSFISVRMKNLEVEDREKHVIDVIHAQPEESGWSKKETPCTKMETYMIGSWLGDNILCYLHKTGVMEYAGQPMPQTAAMQPIKPPPAEADDADSTRNPPKKIRRTGGGVPSQPQLV